MLSKPKNGWCDFKFLDVEISASYLVDIPFDWLKASEFALKNRQPLCLYIDEEGSEVFITSYYDVTHIIYGNDESRCNTSHAYDFMDLIGEIISDIKKYFNDWVEWSPYEDATEERANELKKLISNVEALLIEERKRCKKDK